ncbi:diaminopropionate ammonia-lyase [Pedobacter cryophilus]|uniref:Diaminopropionate ammonia-lyase n=1 Tax=Pedobacter cryophilus TaxID=2571271 RepID=A0A4U1CA41_9SPHI|nr:diaminopropionate ammonia-lyase [Pedobacter cryophilus]TKC00548.1 diaminopropionate ammonia-lyase [Pedobacter cryophilus]
MIDYHIQQPNCIVNHNLTTEILKNSEALKYHQTLAEYKSTPLVQLKNLATKYGVGNIYIKDESHRFGLNAFKALGASYAIYKTLQTDRNISTFCTATDGNHGRAVAWASKKEGKKAVVFVPQDTVASRIKAIENEGAKVVVINGNYDETCIAAAKIGEENGWKLIQDTSSENYEEIPAQIMAGYLTHFQELESTLHLISNPKIDVVFLQAGVGSWAAAGIWYYLNRYGHQKPKIVLVEPYESDGILASFKARKPVTPQGNFKTIMAGLNCGIPSLSAWDIIKNGVDISIKIRDEFAEQAIRDLYYPSGSDERIIAGESGVGGLAGFIAIMTKNGFQKVKEELQIAPTSNILFFNTEGATDPVNFNKIIANKD